MHNKSVTTREIVQLTILSLFENDNKYKLRLNLFSTYIIKKTEIV